MHQTFQVFQNKFSDIFSNLFANTLQRVTLEEYWVLMHLPENNVLSFQTVEFCFCLFRNTLKHLDSLSSAIC